MPDSAPASPDIPRPYDARMLSVGDGHWIYVEEVGNRDGYPALFLHGGPGSGAQHMHRRIFDSARHRAILFDQRGAGRSHPYLSLTANTTQHLVADIEAIREHLAIDKWLVVGGSWGATLALAYAQQHPDRVAGVVLRAVFLGTTEEVDWAFAKGPATFRPDLLDDVRNHLPPGERDDLIAAYVRRLCDPDRTVRNPAAHAWYAYERALSELAPAQTRLPAAASCSSARVPPTPVIEAHYIRNDFFLQPGQLLANAHRLAGIPGAIIQGRYDLLCPPVAAYAVHRAWPQSTLEFVEHAGHAMTDADVVTRMHAALLALTPR